MHYVNYEDAIVQCYGVELVGWTYLRFINLANINSVADIQTLCDALRSGACHWVHLSAGDLQHRKAEVEAWRSQGEIVGKKRKERSDKGMKRKPERPITDENNPDPGGDRTQPGKKRKTGTSRNAVKHIPPKSRAIIEDDEEESEGSNSEATDAF